MNNNEKIAEIKGIILNHNLNECPYCSKPLEEYVDKKGIRQKGCYNHDEGDLIIDTEDYFYAVINIVKFGEPKRLIKMKKITDF